MRVAVIADIHGNLEAFQSVLADIDGSGIEHIVSLGDNIGYGADSEGIMALIRERGIPSVLGNHEMAVKYPRFRKWFNPQVQETLQSVFTGLSPQTLADIHLMSPVWSRWGCRFVHGFPPKSAFLYLYQMQERRIWRAFDRICEKYCFIGHTHDLNLIRVDDASTRFLPFSRGVTLLEADAAYLINVGSVGQPRDGDSHAKYVIWDASASSVEVRWVGYDIETTIRKILKAGYPESFAARLR